MLVRSSVIRQPNRPVSRSDGEVLAALAERAGQRPLLAIASHDVGEFEIVAHAPVAAGIRFDLRRETLRQFE